NRRVGEDSEDFHIASCIWRSSRIHRSCEAGQSQNGCSGTARELQQKFPTVQWFPTVKHHGRNLILAIKQPFSNSLNQVKCLNMWWSI
ncbi:unnamed protein product, partial [Tenebrio molitor]